MARRISFSSAHLYRQPKWSSELNAQVFGRCFTESGHGHNYTLEAFFEGPIDHETGLLINLLDVDQVMKKVIDPLDHQHLNFDIEYFRDVVPTTEVIAQYCFHQIESALRQDFPNVPVRLTKLRLFEMDDLYVEYQP